MRDYGKLFCEFWTSATIQALSDDGKLLAAYLLTNQHCTLIGCYRLTPGYVCDDLNWMPERVSKGFTELFDKGFARRCEASNFVVIFKYLDWNPLENPNQHKSALKHFSKIPDSLYEKDELAVRLGVSDWKPLANPLPTVSKPVAVAVAVTEGAGAKGSEKPKFILPDWIPVAPWTAYIEMRKKAKKAPTDRAMELVVMELAKLRDAGENVAAVLDQSTMRVWTDVYAVKVKTTAPVADAFRGMK